MNEREQLLEKLAPSPVELKGVCRDYDEAGSIYPDHTPIAASIAIQVYFDQAGDGPLSSTYISSRFPPSTAVAVNIEKAINLPGEEWHPAAPEWELCRKALLTILDENMERKARR